MSMAVADFVSIEWTGVREVRVGFYFTLTFSRSRTLFVIGRSPIE